MTTMTREQFTARIKAEIENLDRKFPGNGYDEFKVTKLKDGFRATFLMPVGRNSIEIDWRRNRPNVFTVAVEVPSGFSVRYKPVATFAV